MAKTGPFEKYGDVYDNWFEEHQDLYKAELETIKKLLPSKKANTLEVGVGSGIFAAPLGIETGVDPSRKMAEKARKRGLNVCLGIAEELPFFDDQFDCVLMVTTICFVDDVLKTLREVFRVLGPGGCLILGFIDKQSQLGKQYESKKQSSRFYQEASFFCSEEMLEYLKSTGFEIASAYQTIVPGNSPDIVLAGYGQGSFVAIKGMKTIY